LTFTHERTKNTKREFSDNSPNKRARQLESADKGKDFASEKNESDDDFGLAEVLANTLPESQQECSEYEGEQNQQIPKDLPNNSEIKHENTGPRSLFITSNSETNTDVSEESDSGSSSE
jgi:hypothetical protein